MKRQHPPKIAYIMKGFPRASEPFIANEIYHLEKMGLGIHVFAIQSLSEPIVHSIVKEIKAKITYIPEDASAAESKFSAWHQVNFPQFMRSHLHVLVKRPLVYIATLVKALYYCVKYRKRPWEKVRNVFYKDFLRAGYIASKVIRLGDVRHLHGHFCHGSTTMTMFVSKLTGIPYSFTAHAKDIYLPRLNPGDLLRKKISSAQFVVTCTDANRIHLQNICPEKSSIFTIYHGLDTGRFAPLPTGAENDQVPCILAVGRFVAKKGFRYLIQACQKLKEKGLKFQCCIVGPEDEESGIVRQLIKTFNLENVVSLRSAVSQEELKEIYKDCTVFTLPCQIVDNGDRDGIPNVLAEAMAMGIPVISTAISGIPELVENQVNGLLVPQKDVVALTNALEKLLQDPSLRKKLAHEGRKRICQIFDNKTTTKTLKDLFDSSLSKNLNKRVVA